MNTGTWALSFEQKFPPTARVVEPMQAEAISAQLATETALASIRAGIAELTRRALTAESRLLAECKWEKNEDDGSWDGGCGVKWVLESGTPEENHMHHCLGCGRHLVTVTTPEPTKEDDNEY